MSPRLFAWFVRRKESNSLQAMEVDGGGVLKKARISHPARFPPSSSSFGCEKKEEFRLEFESNRRGNCVFSLLPSFSWRHVTKDKMFFLSLSLPRAGYSAIFSILLSLTIKKLKSSQKKLHFLQVLFAYMKNILNKNCHVIFRDYRVVCELRVRNGLDPEGEKDLGFNCPFLALEMKAPGHSNFQVLGKGNSVPPLREKGGKFAKKGREKSSSRWVIIPPPIF